MASRGSTQEESQSELKARATKEEMQAEIDRLNAIVKDMQDQINEQAATARSGKKGWMISTPNSAYTGRTAGVYFENGRAFIPADLKNARKLVAILTNDFGYSCTETEEGQEVKAPPVKGQSIFEAAAKPQLMN